MRIVASALATGILACAPAGRKVATLEYVLQRYVTAAGGREAIGRLESRTMTGIEVNDLSWAEPKVDTERVVVRAGTEDRYSIKRSGPDWSEREWFDGTQVWHRDPSGAVQPRPDAAWSKFAWLANPQGPLRIAAYFPNPRLAGDTMVNGRKLYVIKCDRPDEYYTLRIDAETFLPVAIGWFWTLADYREVDGVQVPFRVVQSRKGGSTTWIVETVAHNTPLDSTLFARPSKD